MPDDNLKPPAPTNPQGASPGNLGANIPTNFPTTSPTDYFPQYQPTTPSKTFGTTKIIATFFGILILVMGLGAGVVLVKNPQLFEQRASTRKDTCSPGLPCANGYLCVTGSCIPNSDTTSCGRGDDLSLPVCCSNSECTNGKFTCEGTNYVCNSTGVDGLKTCLVKANTRFCGGTLP